MWQHWILPLITLAVLLGSGASRAEEASKSSVRRVLLNGQELTQLKGLILSNADVEYTDDGSLLIRTRTVSPSNPLSSGLPPVTSAAVAASIPKEPKNPPGAADAAVLTGTYWLLLVPEELPPGLAVTVWINDAIFEVFGSNSQQVKEVTHLLRAGDNTVRVGFSSAAGASDFSRGLIHLTLAQGSLDPASQELKLEYPILSLMRKGSEMPGPEEFFKFGLPLPQRK